MGVPQGGQGGQGGQEGQGGQGGQGGHVLRWSGGQVVFCQRHNGPKIECFHHKLIKFSFRI